MTDQQSAKLQRCQATLGEFVNDRYFLLSDWLSELGQSDSDEVGSDAARFVPGVSIWLSEQKPEPKQIGPLLLNLSLLIGEVLVQRFAGCWLLADRVESPHFANYIVTKFRKAADPKAIVNPFLVASAFLSELEAGSRTTFFDVVAAEQAKLAGTPAQTV